MTDIGENKPTESKKPTKKEPKKKPEAKTKTDGIVNRVRSRTTAFEPKQNDKPSNKIVATGIGENRFSNLLSMFDKSKQSENKDNKDDSENKPQPKQLDMQKFGSFSKDTNDDKRQSKPDLPTAGLSIKERMELLKKESEKVSTKGSKIIDPVLEARQSIVDEDNVEEDDDDLNLSDEDNNENDEEQNENSLGLGGDDDEENQEKNEKEDKKEDEKQDDLEEKEEKEKEDIDKDKDKEEN